MTAVKDGTSDGWLVRRWHHMRSRSRFMVSAAIFVALAAALSLSGAQPSRSILLAFDIAAITVLAATAIMFSQVLSVSVQTA